MIGQRIQQTIELGNLWELEVEIEVADFDQGHPGNWDSRPEYYDPGEATMIALGTIRSIEDLEELGIKEGQEIHPAYLLGGRKALRKLEDKLSEDHDLNGPDPYAGWGGPDPYDEYHDR